jgi:hypothetical protein
MIWAALYLRGQWPSVHLQRKLSGYMRRLNADFRWTGLRRPELRIDIGIAGV